MASTRLVAGWFIDRAQAAALEVAERYADGTATAEELAQANLKVGEIADKLFWACDNRDSSEGLSPEEFEEFEIRRTAKTKRLGALCGLWAAKDAASAVALLTQVDPPEGSLPAFGDVTGAAASAHLLDVCGDVDPDDDPAYGAEYQAGEDAMNGRLAALLRDVAGNPFRRAVVDTNWITPVVLAVATGMYDAGDFSAMPVLADALEEAGCTNADLLAHLRGPGPHVRGCWAIDLVLGKS